MIDLAQRPSDDGLVTRLNQHPMLDGGSWHRAVYLVKKYGIMPNEAFPESTSSSDTDKLNRLLSTKIREHGIQLRQLDASIRNDGRPSNYSDPEVHKKTDGEHLKLLHERKVQYLEEVYNILTVCTGVPPGPSDSFVWEYYHKDKGPQTWTGTPIKFRQDYIDIGSGKKERRGPFGYDWICERPDTRIRHNIGQQGYI